jgi:hypothetical protein
MVVGVGSCEVEEGGVMDPEDLSLVVDGLLVDRLALAAGVTGRRLEMKPTSLPSGTSMTSEAFLLSQQNSTLW